MELDRVREEERVRRKAESKELDGPGRREAALGRRLEKYGISRGDFDRILASQGYVCGICRKGMENPQVDHDHGTGHVRGILCHVCNMAIGQLGDSSEGLLRAVAYLQRAEADDPGRKW